MTLRSSPAMKSRRLFEMIPVFRSPTARRRRFAVRGRRIGTVSAVNSTEPLDPSSETITMKILCSILLLGSAALAQTTQRVSVGTGADLDSQDAVVSADGRFVAFSSAASNLVWWDANSSGDVFVRDLQSGAIDLVSLSPAGQQLGGTAPAISADGRYVAFAASYLTFAHNDILLHDRLNGTSEQINVATGGAPGNGGNFGASVSADGRYVAFVSSASNLVPGDVNGKLDVFLRDRQNGTTERVSLANDGSQSNGDSSICAISADGRYVAFSSAATNLVPGDTNGFVDIFVRDRQTATTKRVNVATSGAQTHDVSGNCSISADGRYVVFESAATNLVPGDTNGFADIFVRDLQNSTTERVSVASDGTQANAGSGISTSAISSDGRYVAFVSLATNLVAGDTNATSDAFVHDRLNGTTELVTVALNGAQADGFTEAPSISGDGRVLAFQSLATDLVPGDTNALFDIFARDRQLGTTQLVSAASTQGNAFSQEPSISADGTCIAFQAGASNLVANDTNSAFDIFVFDRTSDTLERASVSTGGAQANGSSLTPALSSDGRYVVFGSNATNLISGDTNGATDIFVRDRSNGTTERVSLANDGSQSNGDSIDCAISADGRFVAFVSDATNLVPGDTNGASDIFVRDRLNATTERVNLGPGGVQALNGVSDLPSISADGRYVAFISFAANLVPGDTNASFDVFVHDRQSATTELVSVGLGGAPANNASDSASISSDGRYVAFQSSASNLVSGDTNNHYDIFVRDRQAATTERVSVATDGTQSNQDSSRPSISGGGRHVGFQSTATNLVAGDTNGVSDIFVHDRLTGTTERASLSTIGQPANGFCDNPSLSSDGRFVAFHSAASDLVFGDTNGADDIFLRDRGAASAFTSFCFGDGTGGACPCANNGAAGHGCQNSAGTGGAVLTGAGNASLSSDTVVLTASNELPTTLSTYLQGTSATQPTVFGDGLRCAGGTLKRLYTKHAVAGVTSAPQAGDASISVRSAQLGDTIQFGATRVYQVYYRDANLVFCAGGFNVTAAIAVAWGL
jgi:Tol biopolymer transport system component